MTGNDDGGIDPRRLPMRAMLAGEQRRHSTRRDELFLGLLTVISLAVMARLSVPRVFRPESAVISVMLAADTLFCVIVLLDVGTSLLRDENTRDYLVWHGILDLLDSVPSWVSPEPSWHTGRTSLTGHTNAMTSGETSSATGCNPFVSGVPSAGGRQLRKPTSLAMISQTPRSLPSSS